MPYIKVFTKSCEIISGMRQTLQVGSYRLGKIPIHQFQGNYPEMSGIALMDGAIGELETSLVPMGSDCFSRCLKGLVLNWKDESLVTDRAYFACHSQQFALGDLKEGLNQVAIAGVDGTLAATAIWQAICRATLPRLRAEYIDSTTHLNHDGVAKP